MYTPEQRLEGITKARLADNIALAKSSQPLHADDAAYTAFVCAAAGLAALPDYAAESYYELHSGKTIQQLEQELVDAVAATPAYEPNITPTVAGVPQSISALNGLLVLDAAGLAPAYEAWATSTDRTFAQKAFINKAMNWRRDDVTLISAAKALGLTDAQIDTLFVSATGL